MGNCFKPKEDSDNSLPLMDTNSKDSGSTLAEQNKLELEISALDKDLFRIQKQMNTAKTQVENLNLKLATVTKERDNVSSENQTRVAEAGDSLDKVLNFIAQNFGDKNSATIKPASIKQKAEEIQRLLEKSTFSQQPTSSNHSEEMQEKENKIESLKTEIDELGSVQTQLETVEAEQRELVMRLSNIALETSQEVDTQMQSLEGEVKNLAHKNWMLNSELEQATANQSDSSSDEEDVFNQKDQKIIELRAKLDEAKGELENYTSQQKQYKINTKMKSSPSKAGMHGYCKSINQNVFKRLYNDSKARSTVLDFKRQEQQTRIVPGKPVINAWKRPRSQRKERVEDSLLRRYGERNTKLGRAREQQDAKIMSHVQSVPNIDRYSKNLALTQQQLGPRRKSVSLAWALPPQIPVDAISRPRYSLPEMYPSALTSRALSTPTPDLFSRTSLTSRQESPNRVRINPSVEVISINNPS